MRVSITGRKNKNLREDIAGPAFGSTPWRRCLVMVPVKTWRGQPCNPLVAVYLRDQVELSIGLLRRNRIANIVYF